MGCSHKPGDQKREFHCILFLAMAKRHFRYFKCLNDTALQNYLVLALWALFCLYSDRVLSLHLHYLQILLYYRPITRFSQGGRC